MQNRRRSGGAGLPKNETRWAGWIVGAAALALGGCSDDHGVTGGGDATSQAEVGEVTETSADSRVNETSTDSDVVETTPDVEDVETVAETEDTRPVDTTPPVPDADVTVDPTLCSAPGGSVNIYDLQNPDCADHPTPPPTTQPGVDVALAGVVITANFGDTFVVQDPRGGPYSGIVVFAHGLYATKAKVGDLVDLTGGFYEFYENSQVYLASMDFLGTAPVPAPYVPAHPAHVATNGELSEMFEGVLVRVDDVYTVHTQPDCPQDYGEFVVTGGLRIDDMGFKWDARIGDHFTSITGPLMYAFGNHKIEPRSADDVVVITPGGPNAKSKCNASECQAADGAPGTKEIVVNEFLADPVENDTNREWLELYNPGPASVDIAGWELRDCGELVWAFPDTSRVIPSHGFLVVGATTNASQNGGAGIQVGFGDQFYFPNTVGSILLYDGPGRAATLVDQVRYSRFEDWSSVFKVGASLERRAPGNDGALSGSWKAATKSFGDDLNKGTPGATNSAH